MNRRSFLQLAALGLFASRAEAIRGLPYNEPFSLFSNVEIFGYQEMMTPRSLWIDENYNVRRQDPHDHETIFIPKAITISGVDTTQLNRNINQLAGRLLLEAGLRHELGRGSEAYCRRRFQRHFSTQRYSRTSGVFDYPIGIFPWGDYFVAVDGNDVFNCQYRIEKPVYANGEYTSQDMALYVLRHEVVATMRRV